MIVHGGMRRVSSRALKGVPIVEVVVLQMRILQDGVCSEAEQLRLAKIRTEIELGRAAGDSTRIQLPQHERSTAICNNKRQRIRQER